MVSETATGGVPAAEPFDYQEQLEIALMATRAFFALANEVDFTQLILRMERADALGPMIDPTLWIKAHGGLDSQRKTIEAAAAFKRALQKQLDDEAKRKPRGS